jgi:hypothetical protein
MDRRVSLSARTLFLFIWSAAGVAPFLPFAVGTSPLDAVLLRVPNEEGNWWHLLVGAPFFLAFAMIWLRLRALFSARPSTPGGRRVIWMAIGVSAIGTSLVEAPFLMHLAGTSEWQRLAVLGLGFGLLVVSGTVLAARRRTISSTRACLIGLNAAYLANAFLCLVVYGEAKFRGPSRSGWFVTMAIVWPMLLELVWLLFRANATDKDAGWRGMSAVPD